MLKKVEPKRQKQQLPLPMIAVGMKHPAMTHAVEGFVPAVRRWDKPLLSLCLGILERLNDKAYPSPPILEGRAWVV
jgi:hypothetical protein